MERVRLNKYLAECGVCSRREADRWIEAGRVMVDGQVAGVGMQVDGHQEILVDGKHLETGKEKVVLLYHKPVGVVCTARDPHASRTLSQEIQYPVRLTYAGRLDRDSEGLLILTNDGDLIEEMMRGSHGHEKEYVVRVNKRIMPDFLEKMAEGVRLKELGVTTKPCRVEQIGSRSFRIVLTQGLNRQIRRMCKALGYEVVALKRERVVNLVLGDLPTGKFREATDDEIRELWTCLKGSK